MILIFILLYDICVLDNYGVLKWLTNQSCAHIVNLLWEVLNSFLLETLVCTVIIESAFTFFCSGEVY